MLRTYLINGQEVTVNWVPRDHPPVYTILVEGAPIAGSVEKSAGGRFLAFDDQHRLLGSFQALYGAVVCVVREEHRSSGTTGR